MNDGRKKGRNEGTKERTIFQRVSRLGDVVHTLCAHSIFCLHLLGLLFLIFNFTSSSVLLDMTIFDSQM